MGQAPAGAGSAAGIAADELASGLPQELDWEKLITHVFRPEHRPVLLLTSRQQLPAAAGSGSRPSSAIDAFRIAEPPADSRAACTGVREAFSPDALGGRVGLVSQKGKKSLPNQARRIMGCRSRHAEASAGPACAVWAAGRLRVGHGVLPELRGRGRLRGVARVRDGRARAPGARHVE
ncbi:unnamed protein product, partial [Prorocentrum cordatum]